MDKVIKMGARIMEKYYCIKNAKGDFWSNGFGWIDTTENGFEEATFSVFTQVEKNNFNLPIGGKWVRY